MWHNGVGCMVGYAVYRGVRWMGERGKKRRMVEG